MQLMPLAQPQVQEMLQKLIEVGKEFQKATQATMKAMAGMGPVPMMEFSTVRMF